MQIKRHYTKAGKDPYASIGFKTINSELRRADGKVMSSISDFKAPEAWSQVACDILARKYFRKAGVPAAIRVDGEPGIPQWLQRRQPDKKALGKLPEAERYQGENDARQVFDRLAGCWAYWGWKGGYFNAESDAKAFYDEMRFMLASQIAAPNSPQWFNTGLHWAYGLAGTAQGHYYVDHETGKNAKVYECL